MGHSATADARDGRLGPHTLFSRRRTRRRPQPRGQYRLPDWIWGLGLGLVILLIVGGFFAITNLGGSGGGTCDNELPRLPGTVEVSAEGFQQEDEALAGVITFLKRGDLDNAFAGFYGDVHSFTHNIDPDVRDADEETAKTVCEAVLNLEALLEGESPGAMIGAVADLREALRDAAEVLGFPRPTG